ncbi:MAG: hypothetical protein JWP34_1882 [Massilia sp.]|nr:hypothetical protein [Massilia sp.]
MKTSHLLPSLIMSGILGLLAGCGGEVSTDRAAGLDSAAPMAVSSQMPRADCESEGCNRPRIVDGLAEQYRAGAMAQQAQAESVAQANQAAQPEAVAQTIPAPQPDAAPARL